MNKLQKIIARIFGIKTLLIERKEKLLISDEEFSEEELKYVADFLNTKAGKKLCMFMTAQKFAVANRACGMFGRGDFWQGYSCGFKAATDAFLTFRQPDANGANSSYPGEVGLEQLADKLDQTES